MEEKVQVEEGLSLLEIIRLLFSKLLILIFVAVVSGFLGGVFAVVKTVDINYWGTQLEFYVNPEKPKDSVGENGASQYGVYGAYGRHVMDNMVKLLSSEAFAEILMEGMKDAPTEKMVYDKVTDTTVLSGEYKNYLARVKNAVTFSYLEANADIDDANNLARSFIYVRISLINDKAFATELLQRVKEEVPIYVKENMTVPVDYSGTNCQQITVMDEIHLTNPGYTTNQAIKYAILAAFAAVAVTCVLIIIIDRSDKRLRDYEAVMRSLEVPVLGVVPTIDPLLAQPKNKAKTTTVKKEVRK